MPTQAKNNTPLLQVKDLHVRITSAGETNHAVRGVSFDIPPQKTFALVGESGSGKSLTALAIAQLIPPHIFPELSGEILFEEQNTLALENAALRKLRGGRIAYIFQDPMVSLNPLKTVFEQIYENIYLHTEVSQKPQAVEVCSKLLEQVRLPGNPQFAQKYPHELSGGQRQRVMIAMALAGKARFLIADEPTTSLDVTVQAEVLNLLADLQRTHALTYLFITHDLSLVRRFADDVAIMRHGRICEQGPAAEVLKHPKDAYTKELFDSEPPPLKRGTPTVSASPPPSRIETGSPRTQDSPPTPAPAPALEVKNLRVRYPIKSAFLRRDIDYFEAVKPLSFTIQPGRTLGIIGESGSGKTSLALAILRLISSEGEIRLDGLRVDAKQNKALRPFRGRMQVVFQDPFSSLSPRHTLLDIISEGLRLHEKDLSKKEVRERVLASMEAVGLPLHAAGRYPHEFSGGERQRIAIARATILDPALLILDEPTSSLDVSLQLRMIEQLLTLQTKKQMAYMFISHDLRVIRALADDIIVLQNGEVRAQGSQKNIFEKTDDPYTQKLLRAAFLK